jgi:solute carrier family 35 (UDP-sugar transporter), member A1/2/3
MSRARSRPTQRSQSVSDDEDNVSLEMRVPEDPEGHIPENTGGATDKSMDVEMDRLLPSSPSSNSGAFSPQKEDSSGKNKVAPSSAVVSRTGLMVLILLAVQNCSKNLLMRYVMKDRPKFLTSAAVLGSEFIKLSLSTCFILLVEGRSLQSIFRFLREDRRNTLLLTVPASAYNLQMSLEYVALANLNAAVFSVLVQTKLLFTATFAAMVLRKKLKYVQVISLVLLTSGVMLCNLSNAKDNSSAAASLETIKGVTATLGIALSSGFASVYTEKVIKAQGSGLGKRPVQPDGSEYGLAYTQVQLSLMSLVTIGIYACMMDFSQIVEKGLFHNFTFPAFLSVLSSAVGGLIVAAVLKYADSVLKGYATAMSVILTGVLSMVLFGTTLNAIYFMGIVNVVTAVLLYNGKDLEHYVC